MENTIVWIAWILGAYLVGGIPFGFLIGKARGVDVRTVGSKNIGATNVYRTVGHKWGFLAFFCDFLKGFGPAFAAKMWSGVADPNFPLYVGLACVVGHTLTPYMKFKGGKGVATAFGMLMALMPAIAGSAFAVFVVTVWLSHYISLGSCLAALFLAVGVWVLPKRAVGPTGELKGFVPVANPLGRISSLLWSGLAPLGGDDVMATCQNGHSIILVRGRIR